mmetsp:Transcript_12534/g.19185  ORF Transcript_12534/g.19185 Transcript_12534/m.19185 type:complete len:448 (+) Transcript_12534:420-1763(+)
MSEEEKKKLASWKVDFKGRDGEKFVIADVKESVQNPRFYAHTEGGLGSDGVMFIQRKEGGVVVLKAVGGVGELFGTLLFKKVQENIQQKHQREHPLWFTPDMRPLRRDSEEFNQFSSNLKILRKINPNHHCASIVHRFLQKKMMLVMTPLPSYSALQCPALSFWDYYTEDVLFSLGAMMAMDMLLNNWDRLPLLWSNSGNPANTLLLHPSSYFLPSPSSSPSSSPLMSLSSPRLGVIDQTPTVIGGEKERQRYFDKVSRVISCTSPPPFTPPPPNPNPSSSYRRLCSPPPPSPFSGSPPSSTLPSPPSSSSSSSSSSSQPSSSSSPKMEWMVRYYEKLYQIRFSEAGENTIARNISEGFEFLVDWLVGEDGKEFEKLLQDVCEETVQMVLPPNHARCSFFSDNNDDANTNDTTDETTKQVLKSLHGYRSFILQILKTVVDARKQQQQ